MLCQDLRLVALGASLSACLITRGDLAAGSPLSDAVTAGLPLPGSVARIAPELLEQTQPPHLRAALPDGVAAQPLDDATINRWLRDAAGARDQSLSEFERQSLRPLPMSLAEYTQAIRDALVLERLRTELVGEDEVDQRVVDLAFCQSFIWHCVVHIDIVEVAAPRQEMTALATTAPINKATLMARQGSLSAARLVFAVDLLSPEESDVIRNLRAYDSCRPSGAQRYFCLRGYAPRTLPMARLLHAETALRVLESQRDAALVKWIEKLDEGQTLAH